MTLLIRVATYDSPLNSSAFPNCWSLKVFSISYYHNNNCNDYPFTFRFPDLSVSLRYIPEMILLGIFLFFIFICTGSYLSGRYQFAYRHWGLHLFSIFVNLLYENDIADYICFPLIAREIEHLLCVYCLFVFFLLGLTCLAQSENSGSVTVWLVHGMQGLDYKLFVR